MASAESFMKSPLVAWVETFRANKARPLEYRDLYEGVFLNDVMQMVDPRPTYQDVIRTVDDEDMRLHNWDLLVKNVKAYYQEVLQQLLIIKLPNIHVICKEPDKVDSFNEVKTALLLILGCAVQCEKKEDFIETIQGLDVDEQHTIVEHIKEVTDDRETMLPLQMPEHLEVYVEKMLNHLTRVLRERDRSTAVIYDIIQERDYYQSQGKGDNLVPPTNSPEKHHLAVELADCKASLRRIRQEFEDKAELVSDLKIELEENHSMLGKLRNENMELIQDARSARTYRDELDVIKEKATKVEKYEYEISKLKEKMNELDFYKARVDALREDNLIIVETKNMLEGELASCHKRVQTVIELENELVRYRGQIDEMAQERDADREKMQHLTEEIARLEYEKKTSMNESANLGLELDEARTKISDGLGGSISDQISETSNAKILRLQFETKRLQQKLDEMRESVLIENSSLNLELEKENQRLSSKVEKLQESSTNQYQRCFELEQEHQEKTREKENLLQTLETVKESAERQVRELETENGHLAQTIDTLRERNEKTNDGHMKDLEKENKRLHDNVSAFSSRVSKLDFENRQLQKSHNKLKGSTETIKELENELDSLDRENSELNKEVATLKLTCDKYETLEHENNGLEVENKKLTKMLEFLQSVLDKKEKLEQDNINLTVENQKLQRTIESLKNSSSRVLELENEKDVLNREIQQLKKSLDMQRLERAKYEQMELDLLDLDNESQKFQKSLEITTNRVHQLEKDNSDLENENEKFQKTIETLKVSSKRFENKKKDVNELEIELSKCQRETASLSKDNKKLKQMLEIKAITLDEVNTKLSVTDQEHRNLKKSVARNRDVSNNVKEIEIENKELNELIAMEKKTVNTLHEDLVNEKIHSQQLSNDLEHMNQELEKIGINKEKLVAAEQAHGDRFKALASLMEETIQKNLEIKEEKIGSLSNRLEESKMKNIKLHEKNRILSRERETLQQHFEEDKPNARIYPTAANPTMELLGLKDHLIEVERTNATLLAEMKNMKLQTTSMTEQMHKLEDKNGKLHNQMATTQSQTSSLQTYNAKLQVETTTLQSQCSSLVSQNATIRGQVSKMETEHERLIQVHEELQTARNSLAANYEALQRIQDQLTSDYDSLISEHSSLKSMYKPVKMENRDLKEQLDSLLQGKNDVNKTRNILDKEWAQLHMEQKSLGNLQIDYNHLRDEHDRLKSNHDRLGKDYRDLLAELKSIKKDYNNSQFRVTELQGDASSHKEQLSSMDLEINKVANMYDAMSHHGDKMEEENKALLRQMEGLISQNTELLTECLSSKTLCAQEAKMYLEKLANMNSQKARLEGKIMEYINRDMMSPKKSRGFGAALVRKAKNIIARAQRSKSRQNLATESADSSSLGSYDTPDAGNDSGRKLGDSGGFISPRLGSQNKSLAKSTTALNYYKRQEGGTQLRTAKSTEDVRLLGEKTLSHDLPGLHQNKIGRDLHDEDGGFRSQHSEMITMKQFLNESTIGNNQSHDSIKDDADSHSSESSDHSNTVQMRHANVQQPSSRTRYSNTLADSHANPQSHQDLNESRMSRISTLSGESNPENMGDHYPGSSYVSPPSTKIDITASTPKSVQDPYGYTGQHYNDQSHSRLNQSYSMSDRQTNRKLPDSQHGTSVTSPPNHDENRPSSSDPRRALSPSRVSRQLGLDGGANRVSTVQARAAAINAAGRGSPALSKSRQLPSTNMAWNNTGRDLNSRPTGAASRFQQQANESFTSSHDTSLNYPPSRPQSAYPTNDFHPVDHDKSYSSSSERTPMSIKSRPMRVTSALAGSSSHGRVLPSRPYQESSNPVERPQSVPPSMFNAGGLKEPPVPPPRRTREIMIGQVSLLREPAQGTGNRQSPMQDQNGPSAQGGNVYHGHLSMNQQNGSRAGGSNPTPTARIPPQAKLPQNKPPAQQPTGTEDQKEHKENSVWRGRRK